MKMTKCHYSDKMNQKVDFKDILVHKFKLEEHSIEVHNSRRPLDRLTLTLTLTFE